MLHATAGDEIIADPSSIVGSIGVIMAGFGFVDAIGKLGVEISYEKTLLGQVGFEKVETNAHGRSLRILERIAPVAGVLPGAVTNGIWANDGSS